MTPDMKRLCEAARSVLEEAETSRPTPGGSEVMIDMEVIVRAVLMELREVSQSVIDTVYPGTQTGDEAEDFAAMIDHILAEPTTA